jgi:hypothetical protein
MSRLLSRAALKAESAWRRRDPASWEAIGPRRIAALVLLVEPP